MTAIQSNDTQWSNTLNELTKLYDIMAKVIILQREQYVDTNKHKYVYAIEIDNKHNYTFKHDKVSKNKNLPTGTRFEYKGNKRTNMSRGYKGSKQDSRRSIRAY